MEGGRKRSWRGVGLLEEANHSKVSLLNDARLASSRLSSSMPSEVSITPLIPPFYPPANGEVEGLSEGG